MANYVVSDTNLTAVANAIRQKGGTSASLEFPDDFVSAIGDIETGGGGGGTDYLAARLSNTLTTYSNNDVAELTNYAFASCSNLQSVSLPNVTKLGDNAFYFCTSLQSVSLPNATRLGQRCFYYSSSLQSIALPKATYLMTYVFQNCTALQTAVFKSNFSLYSGLFSGCGNLSVLVLGASSVCPLVAVDAFTNTPFASGGSGGTLYVPNDLIASYQSASNWSTILGYTNNQIKKIEGSIYE